MEGDAGSGQLDPTPPPTDDDAERSDADQSVSQTPTADDAERSDAEEAVNPAPTGDDAERSDAEEAVNLAPAGDADPRIRRTIVALFAASAVVAAGGGLALWADISRASAARAETAALAAARDCVAATQAPDAQAMTESATKIIECSTGDFGMQAQLYSGLLVDAYKTANAQVEVSDMRTAVERHNPDGSMDILVAMRVRLTNTEKQGEEQGYRLRVRMAPEDGTYKVARMDQVSQ